MAGKDLIAEEKDEIKDEANDAFSSEDMVDSLERELGDEIDDRLGDGEGASDDDDEITEGLNDDDQPAGETDAVDDDDAAGEPEPGADRGDGRDTKGRFASKEEQDAADKASADAKKAGKTPEEQKAAGTAAAAAAKPAAAEKPAAEQPKWEPFQVRADKAIHPMGAARTMRTKDAQGNEHVVIAVPAKEYQQFEHRIGRGIAAERQWREITETRRELELQKTAPKPKTDAEIEASMFVEALSKMPGSEEGVSLLDEIFSPEQLENLKLKVQLAQAKERTDFATSEAKRREDATAGETWQKEQTDTLVNEAFDLVESHPDLKGMSEDEVREILQELAMPVRDKLVFREDGQTYANTEYLFKLLKRGRVSPPPAPAPTNASAAPVVPEKKADPAERFNRGQESAAQPRSTSLKNNRTTRPQPNGRTPREATDPKDDRTPQQKAEDEMRKTRRSMMRTDTLDFD